MSHLKNIAIVGATGSVGKFVVDELLKTGKHNVTAITRADSKAVMPEGVKVAKVNYDDQSSLVEAMKGQDVLIVTMSVMAPPDSQIKLNEAAAAAGVPYIIPNNWGGDHANEKLGDETLLGPANRAVLKNIQDLGKSAWISIVSNFWYEFSLGGSADRYGFDFDERSVVFFDEGKQPINTTTWPQSGLAVARLLSLPEEKLAEFKNKFVYISSFCISQKDMFESVLRVTGTTEKDWKITYEDSRERYQSAIKALQSGDRSGFGRAMYTRMFYPDGSGVYENIRGLQNELLGLPKEDLDEFTKIGISRKDEKY
ncbi:hypothetical protein PFICI_09839 [Pestalotiopsis fici W106-1]|uniref:NmrA-like domain-containing protein n=1 Tax=Pestalotiopsis fici (strain W106-1 / CGMCC3.15140) TaxID=1229662 RepID=W3WXE5_PESFW|nr:uncharacterized protein PFICI_09839 [Pestalotiopsis fici W106-1]ETS77777.1 hypothetical protein PFICI_09839 [Pestalotiopsis fici W106-1]